MRTIDAYKRICFMCERAGLNPVDVYEMTKLLFTLYQDAKVIKLPGTAKILEEDVSKQKQNIRRQFLEIVRSFASSSKSNVKEDAEWDSIKPFVWDTLSVSWIDEKIYLILDQLEEFPPDGKLYRKILEKNYLQKEYLSELQLFEEFHLKKTAYYKKRKDAITLFGVLMWSHAQQIEDEETK